MKQELFIGRSYRVHTYQKSLSSQAKRLNGTLMYIFYIRQPGIGSMSCGFLLDLFKHAPSLRLSTD